MYVKCLQWSYASGCNLALYPGSLGAAPKEPGYEASCSHAENNTGYGKECPQLW